MRTSVTALAGTGHSWSSICVANDNSRLRIVGFAEFAGADALAAAQPLVALRFVDSHGNPTETYPANPNGSPQGISGLTTPDGRFTLKQGECFGACGDAPVMLVNNKTMTSFMTPEAIDELIDKLLAEQPK